MRERGSRADRLLATFLDELDERVRDLERNLLAYERESDPQDRARRVTELFRAVHSLKGAAHAVGLTPLAALCHELESRLAGSRDGGGDLSAELVGVLLAAADALAEAGRALRAGRDLDTARLAAVLGPPARIAPAVDLGRASAGPEASPGSTGWVAPGPEVAVRVEAGTLDAILARSGEASVERRKLAAHVAALEDLRAFVTDWQAEWRTQRRERGDAREAVGAIAGRVGERLSAAATLVDDRASAAAEAVRDLDRVTAALDDLLRGVRMQPFAEACAGLERVVRDLALAQGKEARLEISGGEVALDRGVIAQMRDPLRHLVRNAVDHGVEAPPARLAAGKAAAATVRVGARIEGDRVVIVVSDDGAGFSDAAIRSRAAEGGLPAPRDRDELARLVLTPGFSTRETVTAVSGRGIGLDVVRAAVEALRGTVELSWEPGRGSRCELRVPVSLATTEVVLVRASGALFALPAGDVRRIERVSPSAVRSLEGRPTLVRDGERPVPLVSLAGVLGLPVPELGDRELLRVVRLDAVAGEIALVVDETIAQREVVATNLGRRLRDLPLVSGAAVLETGEVAVLLKSAALARAAVGAAAPSEATVRRTGAAPARRRVLVVDDSATTRSLVRSILEAAGYEVAVAADGAEAWAKLQEGRPDLVVSDVDMPRMDGFTLCEAVRRSPRTRDLPFVLVTALGSDADRARGMEVGADAYVVKAQFDQGTLLETLARLVA